MIILESFQVKSFHFFSKYTKYKSHRKFIRRDNYGYMNKLKEPIQGEPF